ncbi:dickkopf-1 [Apostichopus japonicus]|uniref:Dickkopf-1 n=1 Tax=Stichopus japonicus TaxID=307972 RepID=A0A2G8JX30_STIJA|nr:dickkopf-1 [Apostichopus japonicus]
MVLCYDDDECGRKHFCHGGEGHRSCVPCRKSRKRCHRHDMCCPGYTCQDGRCRLRESRADNNRDDEMSYSEAEDSFWNVEVPRKKHHGEDCENSDDCMEGLCCARHLWSRVCMPMLDEGDLCVKKKDRVSDLFQRCDCKSGLSCKRVPDINTRLHACFPVKSNQASEVVVVDNAQMSSRRESVDNDNDVPLSSGQSKSKRSHPSAEPNEMNEQRAVFSIDQNPHRTVLKRSDSFKDKVSQTMTVS